MPEYALYYGENRPKPIFAECFIDKMSNLKEGDYFVYERNFDNEGHPVPVTGIMKVWNITRITKKCVYIEHRDQGTYPDTYKQVRLVWRDIDARTNPQSFYKGYLKNDSYEYCFHRYVKQDDMNLDTFLLSNE